jgi:hypothetical protein
LLWERRKRGIQQIALQRERERYVLTLMDAIIAPKTIKKVDRSSGT